MPHCFFLHDSRLSFMFGPGGRVGELDGEAHALRMAALLKAAQDSEKDLKKAETDFRDLQAEKAAHAQEHIAEQHTFTQRNESTLFFHLTKEFNNRKI